MERKRLLSRENFTYCANAVEVLISVVVLIAIAGNLGGLVREALRMFTITGDSSADFGVFIGHALNMVIGVEFIKMLTKHTPGSAIEVLLYAIAREMIVEHTSVFQNLVSVFTIAMLFIIRKYLFIHSFGEDKSRAKAPEPVREEARQEAESLAP